MLSSSRERVHTRAHMHLIQLAALGVLMQHFVFALIKHSISGSGTNRAACVLDTFSSRSALSV